jgi:coenzyme F420-reducing hydrogenase beta subunit/ferredoxin
VTKLKLFIDDHQIETEATITILDAARSAGIYIPTLCHHPALEPYGSCRLCTVEIEKNGRKRFVTACNYPVEDGLRVLTRSPEVLDIRKMIAELLIARCPGEKIVQDLAREYGIIRPRFKSDDEKCILCGLCSRVCGELVGVSAINFQNRGTERDVGTPYGELSEDCIGCGACALVCPTNAVSRQRSIFPVTSLDCKEMEEEFLKGELDDDLGCYSELFAARTDIEGQDGGVVTALLARGIEGGLLDAAVVVQNREIYGAKTALVDDIQGIIEARGTKYVRVSVLPRLIEALKKGKRRIAVVGTPCQIRVIRKLQHIGYFNDEFADAEIFLLGLFCFESFDYRDLRARAKELLGIDLAEADKIQIARGKYTVTHEGRDYSCSVRELENEVRVGCRYCGDLVSRLADISIGSIGSPDGYSTVIVRSDRGKKLLDGIKFTRGEANRDDVVKLARLKRRNADRYFQKIMEGLAA